MFKDLTDLSDKKGKVILNEEKLNPIIQLFPYGISWRAKNEIEPEDIEARLNDLFN